MKHVQRRTALAALAGLVVLGAAPAAFAEGEGDEVSESELQEARDLIAEVDSDLAAQGTSVSEQLALLEEETQALELPDSVATREHRQDRLVHPAPQKLDLVAGNKLGY